MKNCLIYFLLLQLLSVRASCQTAEEFVNQGRAFLVQSNLLSASARFEEAVNRDSSNATANTLYAFTRLLRLPDQPAVSNLLTSMGYPVDGRSIYSWRASLPKDKDGIPETPSRPLGVESIVAVVRTEVLPTLAAAASALGRVTDTNFILHLAENETHLEEVTLDFGDTQMIRAGLLFAESLGHWLAVWNLEAQWDLIQSVARDGFQALGPLLQKYPHLLTFSNATDLALSKQAFLDGVKTYLGASLFLRERPLGVTRLIHLDGAKIKTEASFRASLEDLAASFDGLVYLREAPEIGVNLGKHFASTNDLSSLLPQFRNDKVLAKTVPDVSFEGRLAGVSKDDVDSELAKHWVVLPHLTLETSHGLSASSLALHSLAGSTFGIYTSDDLLNWTRVVSVLAYDLNASVDLSSLLTPNGRLAFYQAVEETAPENDSFDHRILLPANGGRFQVDYSHSTTDPSDPPIGIFTALPYSVWWTWKAPADGIANIRFERSFPLTAVFKGESLDALQPVPSLTIFSPNFRAERGVTYQILMGNDFLFDPMVAFSLQFVSPPINDDFAQRIFLKEDPGTVRGSTLGASRELGEPAHWADVSQRGGVSLWWSWIAPESGVYTIDTSRTHLKPIVAIYTGDTLGSLRTVVTNYAASVVFEAVRGTSYQIAMQNWPEDQGEIEFTLRRTPHPANDDFSKATELSGTNSVSIASNLGSTAEEGEPLTPCYYGIPLPPLSTTWWTWRAPEKGFVTLNAIHSDFVACIGVYEGATLDSLGIVSEDQGSTQFLAEKDTLYRIRVASQDGHSGQIILKLSFIPSPANDDFEARSHLAGSPVVTNGSLFGSTLESNEPSFLTLGSVWWSWTAPQAGMYTFKVSSSDVVQLDLYEGDFLESLVPALGDHISTPGSVFMTLYAEEGQTFQIAVTQVSWPLTAGTFQLEIVPTLPPTLAF